MLAPHRTPIHVAFDEVDMYGIVHHSKLLVYLERARIALFTSEGMTPGSLEDTGFGLVVVEANVRFRTPALFADDLVVETSVERLSPVTVTLAYRVVRGSDVILTGTTRLAAVGRDGKPTRLPDLGKQILERYEI
jgi:acyl-CoA thioester hydrolase